MEKILISIPSELAVRIRATIPETQRSEVILRLIEEGVKRGEKSLYDTAVAVDKDLALRKKMEEWDVTLQDVEKTLR